MAKIEQDYVNMQETLLAAGMSGLNLAVVFHEVERGVRALHQVIVEGRDLEGAARQAQELMRILDGFSTLLRRDRNRLHSARKLVEAARQFILLRFRHHRIQFACPIAERRRGFRVQLFIRTGIGGLEQLARQFALLAEGQMGRSCRKMSRLLNAASLWERPTTSGAAPPSWSPTTVWGSRMFPSISCVRSSRASLTGWASACTMPTWQWRLNGGRLAFPQKDEVDVPDECDGAIIAMIFKAGK